MILAVDVGNTQTVLGLFREEALDGHWRVATDATLTADELRVKIGGLLALDGLEWSDIERIVLSSVVPTLTAQYEEMSCVPPARSRWSSDRASRRACRSGTTIRTRSGQTGS